VIIQAAATQSIIQLPDFYCLVIINYTYVLIHNKHCKQYGLLPVLFEYTLQEICTISALQNSPFYTKLMHKSAIVNTFNTPVKFDKLVDPTETKMSNCKHLLFVIQQGTARKVAWPCP